MLVPIGRALSVSRMVLVLTYLILKAVLRANIRKAFAALKRGTAHVLRAILRFLRDLLLALIKPTLTVAGLGAVFAMLSTMKDIAPPSVPATTLAVAAPSPAANPIPPKISKPREATTQLARFHGGAQSFTTEAASITALADALNIPNHVVKNDVPRALDLADTNINAMRAHVGPFPLPKDTSKRLLAVLTPSDIDHLRLLLDYASTLGKKRVSLNADMPSGDLTLETQVTELARGCFRYAMTFARRSFRHTSTATACRKGNTWSFPENRSTP